MSSFNEIRYSLHVSYGANFILEEEFLVLHLPDVNRKTRNENSQQILENIGYGLGVTP